MIQITSYISGSSCIHALDARAKFAALLLLSIAPFLVDGKGLCMVVALELLVATLARIPAQRYVPFLTFAAVLLLFALLFNAFSSTSPNFELIAGFGVSFAGLTAGLFYALRIFSLMFASLIFCFTTSNEEMLEALAWMLRPLAKLHVPTDDIALVLSLALRFIPLVASEAQLIASAQEARGSAIHSGTLVQRLRAWAQVLVPLIVRLFLKAETLGTAMNARCYGFQKKH